MTAQKVTIAAATAQKGKPMRNNNEEMGRGRELHAVLRAS
jgi:hypothetical protein